MAGASGRCFPTKAPGIDAERQRAACLRTSPEPRGERVPRANPAGASRICCRSHATESGAAPFAPPPAFIASTHRCGPPGFSRRRNACVPGPGRKWADRIAGPCPGRTAIRHPVPELLRSLALHPSPGTSCAGFAPSRSGTARETTAPPARGLGTGGGPPHVEDGGSDRWYAERQRSGGGGIRTPGPLRVAGFQDRCLQPDSATPPERHCRRRIVGRWPPGRNAPASACRESAQRGRSRVA